MFSSFSPEITIWFIQPTRDDTCLRKNRRRDFHRRLNDGVSLRLNRNHDVKISAQLCNGQLVHEMRGQTRVPFFECMCTPRTINIVHTVAYLAICGRNKGRSMNVRIFFSIYNVHPVSLMRLQKHRPDGFPCYGFRTANENGTVRKTCCVVRRQPFDGVVKPLRTLFESTTENLYRASLYIVVKRKCDDF